MEYATYEIVAINLQWMNEWERNSMNERQYLNMNKNLKYCDLEMFASDYSSIA